MKKWLSIGLVMFVGLVVFFYVVFKLLLVPESLELTLAVLVGLFIITRR